MRGAGLLAVLTLVAWTFAAGAAAPEPREFATLDVHGNELRLSDFDGQWIVVNFWATWCKPCRKEIPELSQLHDARADVTLIGLAFEDVDPQYILDFLEQYPASYPIALIDVYDPPEHFGVPRVLPTTVLLDPAGRLRKTFLGPVTRVMIEAEIERAREVPTAAAPARNRTS